LGGGGQTPKNDSRSGIFKIINTDSSCFYDCSTGNNGVVLFWKTQGAVFYSQRSEWLLFAQAHCHHFFYLLQKKRHVKTKKGS